MSLQIHLRWRDPLNRMSKAAAAAKSLHSCPTLCNPMDSSPPVSPVLRILQARILEWAAISFSRGSSWPRGQTWVSHIADSLFTIWATWATHLGMSKTKVCWNPGTTGKARNICQVGRFLVLDWHLLSLDFGEGNVNPLQYSCLENPMEGGAW